jgi:hypothetical protein
MKYLVTILILLFASPAFAGGNFSAFDGASSSSTEIESVDKETYQDPEIIPKNSVTGQESEFKINERLYRESIGSSGYYGGGFYGEERYAALTDYYRISYSDRSFEFPTGFIVVNDQLIPTTLGSTFLSPLLRGGILLNRGISINLGGIGFNRR